MELITPAITYRTSLQRVFADDKARVADDKRGGCCFHLIPSDPKHKPQIRQILFSSIPVRLAEGEELKRCHFSWQPFRIVWERGRRGCSVLTTPKCLIFWCPCDCGWRNGAFGFRDRLKFGSGREGVEGLSCLFLFLGLRVI